MDASEKGLIMHLDSKLQLTSMGKSLRAQFTAPPLRQAEHAAAQVAINVLSSRGPSKSLTARGVYKNLLQETTHRAGLELPVYTTVRSGPGHVPVFTCSVEQAGMNFTGSLPRQRSKLRRMLQLQPGLHGKQTSKIAVGNGKEQDQINVAKVLSNFGRKDEIKSIRRDQNQAAGRRMLGGHCEDIAGSSNSLQYQKKRVLDLLMDSASSEGLTSNKIQSSFVSYYSHLPHLEQLQDLTTNFI